MNLPNESTLRNMSRSELITYAEQSDHPLMPHLIRAFLDEETQEFEALQSQIDEVQNDYDNTYWELDEVVQHRDQLVEVIQRIDKRVKDPDHPDELGEDIIAILQRLE